MALQVIGACEIFATDLAGIGFASRLMLLLVKLQQGSAAQFCIANGAGVVTELRVGNEDVTFIACLSLKRLGAIRTVNVAQLKV